MLMRYRLLGRSGLRVSEVGLGAMTFSDRGLSWGASPEESRAIFSAFADAGGTFVDTANIYGDVIDGQDHASERVLADLIAADREHFVVATKYTSSNTRDISRSGNSFKAMRQTVDAGLRALRTDYIDLLWLHTWDGTTPIDEILRAATQLVTAGKILYFGLSDTPAWVVSAAATLADAHGWTPPVAIQVQYNLAERTVEQELLPMAQTFDLGVAAWSPLAAGFLTGKYTRPGGTGDSAGDRFSDANWGAVSDTAADPRRLLAETVDAIADELGRPSAHVALAWLRQRPGVVVPIIGARRRDQMVDNLGCLDLTLDAKHIRRLNEVSTPSLGFPQGFLSTATVRRFSTSGHYDSLDNHRKHGYAEFAVD
jgi:aryl-alcohol dehydrogenase-like predicted oxidoreductase